MTLLIMCCIALGGSFFLVLSAILGGDSDAGGHDVTDAGDGGSDGHHFLSMTVWSGFATLFGASGAISIVFGLSIIWAILIALVFGIIGGLAIDLLLVMLYKSQSNSVVSLKSLIGKDAKVTLEIQKAGDWGEVSVECSGSYLTFRATTFYHENLPILKGSIVRVVSADPTGLIVAKPE